jgi:hypothetical protein
MFFQRIRAWIDVMVTDLFGLSSMGTGNPNKENLWTYFADWGPTIGIVGANGRVHTLVGYWAVHHYHAGHTLTKRIPVRNDLKRGERLATRKEIEQRRKEITKGFRESVGGIGFFS